MDMTQEYLNSSGDTKQDGIQFYWLELPQLTYCLY